MNSKNLSLIIVLLSLAGCGGSDSGSAPAANASTASASMLQTATTGTASAAATDSRQFLIDVYQDGLGEIQLSQQALQASSNSEVKGFAQAMIDQHTAVNSLIAQLAQRKGITLPNTPSSEQQTLAGSLAGLSGAAFDRAYMAGNVDSHEKDVTAARQQARQGDDAEVRLLAETALPLLKLHLAAAEQILDVLDPAAFLASAFRDGLLEIRAGQLAVQRAANAEVRQFGQRMIDDHTQANARITALAQEKGITLPSDLSPEQQAELAELTQFSGADFDKTYMDRNVVTHALDVTAARRQSEQGSDPDVKNLAAQALPVLKSHLASATDINGRIEASFLYRAYQDGKAEIGLSTLALAKASDTQVKTFAQRMITDHAAANQQIRQLAQQNNVLLPTDPSSEELAGLLDLLGRSGADFDRRYMDINVQAHQRDVNEAAAQAQDASNSQIQAFAAAALPVLQSHLDEATRIRQALGGTTQP